ncbi:hypothetical protein F9278_17690 [Streptomyces phaeolivaceus]|uniref:Uncharacterized protein n=1 Tax=Streptomyces phaeolivaceus TaxID=2653200 RepID=A0A5P8K3X4_9ACTN|nr:hypothetical protein [Streptomyces phaeolivaceus]QFQ97754.1 hypothetical protein F9278_17690 [Streptomyces phaeolivaceus]
MSAQAVQGTHLYILTLEKPGLMSVTRNGTLTPEEGSTEQDVLSQVYGSVTGQDPRLAGACINFWLLKPNRL